MTGVTIRHPRRAGGAILAALPLALLLLVLAAGSAVADSTRKLSDPVVSPRTATVGTSISFAVTFTDTHDRAPRAVTLFLNHTPYRMTADSTDWSAGVVFHATVTPAVGKYDVAFAVEDWHSDRRLLDGGTLAIDAASEPTPAPTPEPTTEPTPAPTPAPTPEPTSEPTPAPTIEPTPGPTTEPTPPPTTEPTPTTQPTPEPTAGPTSTPVSTPTLAPTPGPTATPTSDPWPTQTSTPVPVTTPTPGSTSTPTPSSQPTAGPGGGGTTGGGATPGGGGSNPDAGTGSTGGESGSQPGGGATTDTGTTGSGPGSSTVDGTQSSQGDGVVQGAQEVPVAAGSQTRDRLAAISQYAHGVGTPDIGLAYADLYRYPQMTWQELARALAPTIATITTGGTAWAAFMLFGKKRRDGDVEPFEDPRLASAAACAYESQAAPGLSVVDEALLPRWRRPSLQQFRRTDPMRAEIQERTLSFESMGLRPLEDYERRRIGYRLVRLLDSPDEFRATDIGILDRGDEVQLLERYGVYWRVLCPDGREGWIHRMTLAEPSPMFGRQADEPMPQYGFESEVAPAPEPQRGHGSAFEPEPWPESAAACETAADGAADDTADISSNGLLEAYMEARREVMRAGQPTVTGEQPSSGATHAA